MPPETAEGSGKLPRIVNADEIVPQAEPKVTLAQKYLPMILPALILAVIGWAASIAVVIPQLTAGQARIERQVDKMETELKAELKDTQKMIYDIYKGNPIANPAKRGTR